MSDLCRCLSRAGNLRHWDLSCSRLYRTLYAIRYAWTRLDIQFTWIWTAVCIFILPGCVSLLAPSTLHIKSVTLAPDFSFPSGLSLVHWSLAVERPIAADPFDSRRIIVNLEDKKGLRILEPLANFEWNDCLPVLVQQQTILAFEQSGKIIGVGQTDEDFTSRFVLQLHIQRAEIILTGLTQQNIRFDLSARLVSRKNRKVVAQRTFTHTCAIPVRTESVFLQIYKRVLEQTLVDVVLWTLREGSSASL